MATGPSEDLLLFHTETWERSDRISSHLSWLPSSLYVERQRGQGGQGVSHPEERALGAGSPSLAPRKPPAHARLPHTISRLRPDSARVTHFRAPSSPRELAVQVMSQETHSAPPCLRETLLHTRGRKASPVRTLRLRIPDAVRPVPRLNAGPVAPERCQIQGLGLQRVPFTCTLFTPLTTRGVACTTFKMLYVWSKIPF